MSGLGLRAHVEVSILVGAHPHRVVSNGGGRSIGATRGTVRSLVSTKCQVMRTFVYGGRVYEAITAAKPPLRYILQNSYYDTPYSFELTRHRTSVRSALASLVDCN